MYIVTSSVQPMSQGRIFWLRHPSQKGLQPFCKPIVALKPEENLLCFSVWRCLTSSKARVLEMYLSIYISVFPFMYATVYVYVSPSLSFLLFPSVARCINLCMQWSAFRGPFKVHLWNILRSVAVCRWFVSVNSAVEECLSVPSPMGFQAGNLRSPEHCIYRGTRWCR